MEGQEMAKKKTSRIMPALHKSKEKTFGDLDTNDCFIDSSGDLLIKTDDIDEQSGVSLSTGMVYSDLCNCQVTPVDIQITWKKK